MDIEIKSTLSCPICMEESNDPRILPCQHSFCEACLSTHIKVSREDRPRNLLSFTCPVCRRKTKLRNNTDDASSFKKDLTKIALLQSKHILLMQNGDSSDEGDESMTLTMTTSAEDGNKDSNTTTLPNENLNFDIRKLPLGKHEKQAEKSDAARTDKRVTMKMKLQDKEKNKEVMETYDLDVNEDNMSKSKLGAGILDCPLCLKTYKDPRVLPCQHSVCRECLSMYIKRKIDEGGRQTRLPCPVCKRKTKLRDASSFKKNLTISGFLDSIQKTSAEKKGKAETTQTQICFEDIHIESNDEVNVINKKDIVNRKDETGKHLENEKYVVVATQEENITVGNPIDNTNQKLLSRISLILFSAFLSIKNQKLLSRISLILFSAFLSIKNQKLLPRISLILFSAFLSIKNQELLPRISLIIFSAFLFIRIQKLLPRISVILLRLFLTINFWPQIAFLYVLYVVDVALIIVSFFFLPYLAVLFITLDFTLNYQRRLSLINVLYENHVIVKKRGTFLPSC